jgi:isopentenyl-diphosphate Delta-isomerase
MKQEIILVDRNNRKIGVADKIRAHRDGKLHRAFSIFVFNSKGELLLQRRAKNKYHSESLWSNTVCSHPRPGETTVQAAHRRLREEMGFDCKLKKLLSFVYRTGFKNGLSENEFDFVFAGKFDGVPKPDPKEISNYRWISLDKLKKEIAKNPSKYSVWLKIILRKKDFYKY